MWSKGNTTKNGEQTIGFSFTTMLPTPVGLVKGFLANNNVRKLEHPPYSPNLVPA
jgi:hypothetical protein